MAVRAPDGRRHWVRGSLAFGHCLLRTIPDSRAEDPASNDVGNPFSVVMDGWIDNRSDVCRRLGKIGDALCDGSDAELVLQAYQTWGTNCLEYLVGDFAFAIWDSKKGCLFLARDHFGLRPLFYARQGSALYFASNLDALVQIPGLTAELDEDAIGDFLLFGGLQSNEATIHRDLRRLAPAHFVRVDRDRFELQRYWQPPEEGEVVRRSDADYLDSFREVFDLAVRDRVRHQGLACELSGGMDCSSVAALAIHSGNVPATYTVITGNLCPNDREHEFAALVAAHLRVPWTTYSLADYALFERHDQTELRTAEPLASTNLALQYDSFEGLARGGARVLLSGQGGDALFNTGSENPVALWRTGRYAPALRETLRHLRWRGTLRGLGLRSLLGGSHASRQWMPEFPGGLNPDFVHRAGLRERYASSQHVIHGAVGVRAQLMSPVPAAVFDFYDAFRLPLVFRHPFFDMRLANFMLATPRPAKQEKYLLRERMRGLLPETIRTRPKTALVGDPVRARFGSAHVRAIVDRLAATDDPHIDPAALRRAIAARLAAPADISTWYSYHALAPIALGLWKQSVTHD